MRVSERLETLGRHGQPFQFIQAYHKDKGWVQVGDNVEEMNKDQLAQTKDELHAHQIAALVGLNDKDCKLSAVGEKKINDKPAIGVRVERGNQRRGM